MRLCDSRLSTSPEAVLDRISALESRPAAAVQVSVPSVKEEKPAPEVNTKQEEAPMPDDAPPFDFDDVPPPVDAPPEAKGPELPKPLGSDMQKVAAEENLTEMIAYGDILEEIKSSDVMFFSLLDNSRGYLDGDVVTIKAGSMAVFMASADATKMTLVTECASKILGYPVTVKIVEDVSDAPKKNDDFPIF